MASERLGAAGHRRATASTASRASSWVHPAAKTAPLDDSLAPQMSRAHAQRVPLASSRRRKSQCSATRALPIPSLMRALARASAHPSTFAARRKERATAATSGCRRQSAPSIVARASRAKRTRSAPTAACAARRPQPQERARLLARHQQHRGLSRVQPAEQGRVRGRAHSRRWHARRPVRRRAHWAQVRLVRSRSRIRAQDGWHLRDVRPGEGEGLLAAAPLMLLAALAVVAVEPVLPQPDTRVAGRAAGAHHQGAHPAGFRRRRHAHGARVRPAAAVCGGGVHPCARVHRDH